jgi:hypothetical protein
MSTKLNRRAMTGRRHLYCRDNPGASAGRGYHSPRSYFAAIEVHRAALLQQMEKSWSFADLDVDAPDYNAAEAEEGAARDVEEKIQMDLANVQPTTLGGVLALLAYVDEICLGGVKLPHDPDWRSDVECLHDFSDDAIVDSFDGKPLELPLLFWLMRNVRNTLQGLAVTEG